MKPALLLYPHISSYPVLLLLGFFFGWLLARRRSALFGIKPSHLDNISLLLPIAGLFGARFFARLFYAKLPLLEALKVWEGDGLVFYGGFIFSIAAVIAYAFVRGLNLMRLLDCLAPSAALGLAFGRVGCFLAGCCWGDFCVAPAQLAHLDTPTVEQVRTFPAISSAGMPLAVQFPSRSAPYKQQTKLGLLSEGETRSLPVHPVQLYEAGLALALAFALHASARLRRREGNVALALLAGYAAIRFCTEYLRADNRLYWQGFTFSQVVSIWITLTCIGLAGLRSWITKRNARALIPAPVKVSALGR